jgi:hypothetical protein
VVARGVVSANITCQSPHAPAAEHFRGHEPSNDQRGLGLIDEANQKALPHVGNPRVDRLLLAVRRTGECYIVASSKHRSLKLWY